MGLRDDTLMEIHRMVMRQGITISKEISNLEKMSIPDDEVEHIVKSELAMSLFHSAVDTLEFNRKDFHDKTVFGTEVYVFSHSDIKKMFKMLEKIVDND